MWMLSFFPDLAVHLTFLAGVILLALTIFLGMIPFVGSFKTSLRILGIFLLGWGLYLEGGLAYKDKIAKEVAELQAKLADAHAQAEHKNVEIVEKIVKDTQVIREKGKTITQFIDREIVKYDNSCIIPQDVIDAHNKAASLEMGDTEKK